MPLESGKLFTLGSLSDKFSDLKVIAGGGGGVVLSGVDKSCSYSSRSPHEPDKVALKRLSLVGKGHCRVALRELRLLKRFKHENLVKTIKITDANGSIIEDPSMENFKDLDSVYVVEELMDTDMHKVLESNDRLPLETTKLFMYQLLRGIKYIHSANVIHRDIKPGNLFINIDDLTLKIGDYGLARVFDDLYDHEGYLTALVSTRYYRAPEVMFNLGDYSFAIDIWSAGCVFGELLLNKVIFPGENDLDQLNVICNAFGTSAEVFDTENASFPEHYFEDLPPEAIDLLSKLLALNPADRLTAEEALEHPFFSELHDPIDEPVCEHPFHIEHEIDNLPVKVLKQKILRNSCLHTIQTNSYHSSQDEMFKDFDDSDILKSRHRNNMKLNSRGDENTSSEMTTSSNSLDSGCRDIGYVPFSSNETKDDYIPSLKSAMDHETLSHDLNDEFIPSLTIAMDRGEMNDEPFVDPGVCERKYHDDTNIISDDSRFTERDRDPIQILKDNISTVNCHEQSYFSDLSPVIDISDPMDSADFKTSFLEYQRLSNNDHGQLQQKQQQQQQQQQQKHHHHHHHHHKNSKQKNLSTSSTSHSSNTNSDNSGTDFRTSENKIREALLGKKLNHHENVRTLNGTVCPRTCRMEDILTKKLANNPPQLVHWDSLRFWI